MAEINPRWIKLKQATQYGSMCKKRLIDLARSGAIKGFQDPDSKKHDWIFDRKSIDAYREGQAPALNAKQKSALILQGVNI